ncbi:unnamed protein product, partial [Iphiclides podalirius]
MNRLRYIEHGGSGSVTHSGTRSGTFAHVRARSCTFGHVRARSAHVREQFGERARGLGWPAGGRRTYLHGECTRSGAAQPSSASMVYGCGGCGGRGGSCVTRPRY